VVVSMLYPEMHLVHKLMLPEHYAQLELQGWQLPSMAVKPEPQEVTHCPRETMPEAHWQTPLMGEAPTGHEVWHEPWK
jgi:hypothetical protein